MNVRFVMVWLLKLLVVIMKGAAKFYVQTVLRFKWKNLKEYVLTVRQKEVLSVMKLLER